MSKLEEKRTFWLAGSRMRPATRPIRIRSRCAAPRSAAIGTTSTTRRSRSIDELIDGASDAALRLSAASRRTAGGRGLAGAIDPVQDDRSASETGGDIMKPCVFIHSNPKQISARSWRSTRCGATRATPTNSTCKIIEHETYPLLRRIRRPELPARRRQRVWLNDDLQSFTPLRFMPPELMGYQGRARRHRSRHLRRRRRLGAAVARHAGQGDHVPAPRGTKRRTTRPA